ncbi:MAG: ASKHA domain-containing protein [Deltaproteobacteria bacterium]|nr:ASKHA domain-containing protein [Deltaproteobacteria bacterium]
MQNGYFLGVDLGTTTVAAALVNRKNSVISSKSISNFQYPEFGLDSIKRIQSGLDLNSVKKLQQKAIATINALIDDIKKETGIGYSDIEIVAIAGNTVMEMALCGYPLISLSKPPYRPAADVSFPDKTSFLPDFYLKNRELFIFPILDGFVGGDAVASIYYLSLEKRDKPVFLADFGTNVEIAIGNKRKIYTASAPAGPAFEGGNIKYGMTAETGAISDVELKNGAFKLKTVAAARPRGICGSGIMSLIHELLRENVIDRSGRILPPGLIDSESYPVIDAKNGRPEVVLYFDGKVNIRLFQEDVRQFQLAKSAVKSASAILMEKFKISGSDDFDVYLSGTFGSHIKPEIIDLIDIFPFKGKRINFIEDSVLLGCQKYVTSKPSERENDLSNIIKISKNFPLSGSKLFEKRFIGNISFLP